jgi:hypothetical protein
MVVPVKAEPPKLELVPDQTPMGKLAEQKKKNRNESDKGVNFKGVSFKDTDFIRISHSLRTDFNVRGDSKVAKHNTITFERGHDEITKN